MSDYVLEQPIGKCSAAYSFRNKLISFIILEDLCCEVRHTRQFWFALGRIHHGFQHLQE